MYKNNYNITILIRITTLKGGWEGMLPIRNQSELLNKNSKLVTSNSLQYIKYTTGTLLQG